MKNGDIFKKTMPFVWRRLGMYLLLNIGIILYFALVIFLITLFAANGGVVGIIIALILCPIGLRLYTFGCDYIGYMIKAAHVAAIGELAVTGTIPQGMTVVQFGKSKVKERFVASNVYFGLDKLVTGAVKQIQNMITRVGNIFGNIEFIQNIIKILNIFVEIVLGYVDEAVLARVFYKKEENAWKASADGVVLYFQSWKEILKNAAMLVIMIILFYGIGMGLIYGVAMILGGFESFNLLSILVLIVGFFLIDVFKQSFLDSYITVSVVNKYMSVTVNQTPQFDLYEKARGWSKKFKELCGKAEAEGAVVGTAVAAQPVQPGVPGAVVPTQVPVQAAVVPTPVPAQQPVAPMQQPVMPTPAPIQQPVAPAVAPTPVQPMMQPVQPAPVAPTPAVQPMPQAPVAPAPAPVQPTVAPAPMPQPVQPAPAPMAAPVAPAPVAPAPVPVQQPAAPVQPVQTPVAPVQTPQDPTQNTNNLM